MCCAKLIATTIVYRTFKGEHYQATEAVGAGHLQRHPEHKSHISKLVMDFE